MLDKYKRSVSKTMIVIIIIVIVIALGGIGAYITTIQKPTSTITTTTITSYSFKMPSGSPTGTYYIALSAIASVVSKYNPEIYAIAVPGGGSVSNCRAVGKGESPISMSTSMVAYFAYTGTETFKGEAYPKLRSMGPAHPLIVSFIVRADSGMRTIYDLKGKRIAIGEPGSGDAVVSEILLKEAGIWDAVIKVSVGDPESWDSLQKGTIDAAIHHTIVPNPNLYERSVSTPITLVEIPDNLANSLSGKYPYMFRYIVKRDGYNGMVSDVKVLAIPSILITNANVPNDLVYKFVKTYWEHFDEIVKAASFLSTIDRNNPLGGIAVPLHPGAYQYWKEKGISIPPQLSPP